MKLIARLAAPAILLTGCQSASLPDATGEPLNVRAAMMGEVNNHVLAMWDVSNAAMSETGGIDPALMDAAAWAKLDAAATKLEQASIQMADAEKLIAAGRNNMPDNEGEPGVIPMADVQRHLDANPAAFRALARAMGTTAANLARAARLRDAETAGTLVEQINLDCEACHSQFWYPAQ